VGDKAIEAIVSIATAIVGIAILATLVSKSANTSGVISTAGQAFARDIQAAVSPVTGGTFNGQGGASLPLYG
jgi:hypothetical protein